MATKQPGSGVRGQSTRSMAAEHPQHVSGARVQNTEASVHGSAPATGSKQARVNDESNHDSAHLLRCAAFPRVRARGLCQWSRLGRIPLLWLYCFSAFTAGVRTVCRGIKPCTSYSRTNDYVKLRINGYDTAYTFTQNNITLEHNAMNNKNTITHMDAHNTQY